jgi:hypothetical protein
MSMDTSTIAQQMEDLGFSVLRFEEGDHDADGAVYLREDVHVQVPTFGRGLCVNRFDGEAFHHSPTRAFVADLKEDIKLALAYPQAPDRSAADLLFDVLCNGEVIEQREALDHASAQSAVDADFTPETCVVFIAEGSEHLRHWAIAASKTLAERAGYTT